MTLCACFCYWLFYTVLFTSVCSAQPGKIQKAVSFISGPQNSAQTSALLGRWYCCVGFTWVEKMLDSYSHFSSTQRGQTGGDLVCRWEPEQSFLSKDVVKKTKGRSAKFTNDVSPSCISVWFRPSENVPSRGEKKEYHMTFSGYKFSACSLPWGNILDVVPPFIT